MSLVISSNLALVNNSSSYRCLNKQILYLKCRCDWDSVAVGFISSLFVFVPEGNTNITAL